MDTFGSVMHRNGSASKKRRQSDRYEESCVTKKKKRKEKPKITNVCPLGELARREEQRYVLLLP
jgi:hypothetical protein